MSESSDDRAAEEASDRRVTGSAPDDSAERDGPDDSADPGEADDIEALRRAVEEKYDFDDFGPADMAEMTVEEWEAAFDPDSWIVGPELLDRVEDELHNRVAMREVFAKVERYTSGGEPRLVAYSDEGYAIVYPDGSVEGQGTVLRDVTPTVALCSMDDYEVAEPPANVGLPAPDEVPEGSGEFGNLMLQVVAFVQILGGLALLGAWLFGGVETIVAPVAALFFVLIGVFLFFVVANARLSDRFRSEEYRRRLRAVGLEEGERPDFLPPLDEDGDGTETEGASEDDVAAPPAVETGTEGPAEQAVDGAVEDGSEAGGDEPGDRGVQGI
jgi:hypothetical protein